MLLLDEITIIIQSAKELYGICIVAFNKSYVHIDGLSILNDLIL